MLLKMGSITRSLEEVGMETLFLPAFGLSLALWAVPGSVNLTRKTAQHAQATLVLPAMEASPAH
jgi:hypothetical protein